MRGPRSMWPVGGVVRRDNGEPVKCAVGVESGPDSDEISLYLADEVVLLTGDAEATLVSNVRRAGAEKRKANDRREQQRRDPDGPESSS